MRIALVLLICRADLTLNASETVFLEAESFVASSDGWQAVTDPPLLLTTDTSTVPDHVPFGPQTYVRVTVGPGYERPLYVHVFADHYRDPWYSHHWLAQDGRGDGIAPPANQLLRSGDRTPWCNLTPLVYQDSGAILNISARYAYHDKAERLRATFEFATGPHADSVVRTLAADCSPNGLVVVMPPDLATAENVARFGRDLDFAERIGKLADEYRWPEIGQRPERFPFFVSASLGGYELPLDARVTARERRTLDYFGFSNDRQTLLQGGIWLLHDGSYSRPDEAAMQRQAEQLADEFRQSKKANTPLAFCLLMDEPAGQADALLATDAASIERFQAWLKQLGKSPADLGVTDWEQVKPVVAAARDERPELHWEIGAVEDLLVPALPVPAQVAILVSSSSDIWTLDRNHSSGFDRMHTWLALAHAQVPVDVLGERQVEQGGLRDCKVCYLSGPNLTQAAATAVRQWVEQGGTLWLTAAAGSRDEYNRVSSVLADALPVERSAASDANPFLYGGNLLRHLPLLDEVRLGEFAAPVLSVKQDATPRPGATVLARFRDGAPALTVGPFGKGRVYCAGFLPGLSYIYPALVARHRLQNAVTTGSPAETILARSDNPWQFPREVRECLLEPVTSAGVVPPIQCSEPLVDAVLMDAPQGQLLPLANYSLRPIDQLRVRVRTARPVRRVESVHRGRLEFRPIEQGGVEFTLPLESTDFVRLMPDE